MSSLSKRTKKNISNNPTPPKKNKKIYSSNDKEFIKNLLNKQNTTTKVENNNQRSINNERTVKPQIRNKMSKKNRMLNNFHKAVTLTNSDDIIMKMLQLKENDIVNFYSNLENMIGSELTNSIKTQMNMDIKNNTKNKIVMCPFCRENKSNCVILLCGHMLCHKCGKNINRCKYPCPKCKKPIKYIQFIAE